MSECQPFNDDTQHRRAVSQVVIKAQARLSSRHVVQVTLAHRPAQVFLTIPILAIPLNKTDSKSLLPP